MLYDVFCKDFVPSSQEKEIIKAKMEKWAQREKGNALCCCCLERRSGQFQLSLHFSSRDGKHYLEEKDPELAGLMDRVFGRLIWKISENELRRHSNIMLEESGPGICEKCFKNSCPLRNSTSYQNWIGNLSHFADPD